jgi:hypothetical protein
MGEINMKHWLDYDSFFQQFILAKGLKDGDGYNGFDFVVWINRYKMECVHFHNWDHCSVFTEAQELIFINYLKSRVSGHGEK